MNLFYVPDIKDEYIHFPDEEARHAVQVMRKKVGEELVVVDGKGNWYTMQIDEIGKKRCSGPIIEKFKTDEPLPFQLHIAIAPTKNISRFEWFLEKTTEIGIAEITPIICKRSERKNLRADRLEKIIVAAMKQSLKATLPKLNASISINDFIKQRTALEEEKYIAYLGDDTNGHLKANYTLHKDVCILIGPEGDFTPEEIQLAKNKGFIGVSLGKSRLRTETAGIIACHIIQLLNS